MTCTVEARSGVRHAAEAIGALPCCVGVDMLAPDVGPHAGWTLEATLDADRVPACVLRELAIQGLALRTAARQGTAMRVVATA